MVRSTKKTEYGCRAWSRKGEESRKGGQEIGQVVGMWHATTSSNNYHQRLSVRSFLDQLFHGLTDVFLSKIQYRINNITHRQPPFELSICILSWCSCFEILCLVISWKIWHFNVEMLQFCIQRKITLSLSLSLSIAPIIYIYLSYEVEEGVTFVIYIVFNVTFTYYHSYLNIVLCWRRGKKAFVI